MKVSVCMITYNHERYIAQAIESVLMQETDFDYELIIGEDCSTDSTRAICLTYQQTYPDKIKLRLPEKNLGMMPNFIENIDACTGEYIALIEGDDYWTDRLKLQKQVDFMDLKENADFVICFHNMKVVYEGVDGSEHLSNANQQSVSSLYEVIQDWYMMTASILFRRAKLPQLPSWFSRVKNGDYALQLLLTYKGGKIRYLDDTMGVYRRHDSGAYSWMKGAILLQALIFLFEKFNSYSNYSYKAEVSHKLAHLYLELIKIKSNERWSPSFWSCIWNYIYYKPQLSKRDIIELIKHHVLPSRIKNLILNTRSSSS